jgi:hypothetical protein
MTAHTLLFLVILYLSMRLNLFELRCWQYKVLFLGNDAYCKIREQLNPKTTASLSSNIQNNVKCQIYIIVLLQLLLVIKTVQLERTRANFRGYVITHEHDFTPIKLNDTRNYCIKCLTCDTFFCERCGKILAD